MAQGPSRPSFETVANRERATLPPCNRTSRPECLENRALGAAHGGGIANSKPALWAMTRQAGFVAASINSGGGRFAWKPRALVAVPLR